MDRSKACTIGQIVYNGLSVNPFIGYTKLRLDFTLTRSTIPHIKNPTGLIQAVVMGLAAEISIPTFYERRGQHTVRKQWAADGDNIIVSADLIWWKSGPGTPPYNPDELLTRIASRLELYAPDHDKKWFRRSVHSPKRKLATAVESDLAKAETRLRLVDVVLIKVNDKPAFVCRTKGVAKAIRESLGDIFSTTYYRNGKPVIVSDANPALTLGKLLPVAIFDLNKTVSLFKPV